jgi:hypothetical protein
MNQILKLPTDLAYTASERCANSSGLPVQINVAVLFYFEQYYINTRQTEGQT